MHQLNLQSLLEVLWSDKLALEFLGTCFDHLSIDVRDLAPFTFFQDAAYTRNLIIKNEYFELLLISWSSSSLSRL